MGNRESPRYLFDEAWSALGGQQFGDGLVDVQGWDDADSSQTPDLPMLPSSLPVMEAMVAAVSASTLAASVLDAARSSTRTRPIMVDARHVAAAARSERYVHEVGEHGAVDTFAPLSKFWRTADGWLRLHANYEWHRERALGVLGCADQAEEVASAISTWAGDDLEEALNQAGALGYVVRSRAAWNVHPHGQAVADALLVARHIVAGGRGRVGDRGGRFAAGIRVLDLTRVIAGPVATKTLAAWGADVLRIDSPHLPEIPGQALDMLPGKRSALLDFATPFGLARLDELLAEADVVVHGYRPGALERYGLASDALAERHPHLSVVRMSAWGPGGPWSGRRGFDSLVQCATGIAEAEGSAERPGVLPAQALDHASGYLAAAAAMLSLAGVKRGGPPVHMSVSLVQMANWLFRGGLRGRATGRDVSPDDFHVTLTGAQRPVRVIAPPGRVDGEAPRWSATTSYGADAPTFLPAS